MLNPVYECAGLVVATLALLLVAHETGIMFSIVHSRMIVS